MVLGASMLAQFSVVVLVLKHSEGFPIVLFVERSKDKNVTYFRVALGLLAPVRVPKGKPGTNHATEPS